MTKRGSESVETGEPDSSSRAIARQDAADNAAIDAALARRLIDGDHAALGEIYDRHGSTVYSIALSILHNPQAAEDVAQDVFVTLWNRPERYNPEIGRFAPWFYRVARNRAIDVVRQRRREVMPEDPAVFDLMLGPSEDAPASAVVERSEAQRVRSALSELPDEQRMLIELAYFGGLTQSQMANRLDIPLGTIKTRVRTGLLRLREMLND